MRRIALLLVCAASAGQIAAQRPTQSSRAPFAQRYSEILNANPGFAGPDTGGFFRNDVINTQATRGDANGDGRDDGILLFTADSGPVGAIIYVIPAAPRGGFAAPVVVGTVPREVADSGFLELNPYFTGCVVRPVCRNMVGISLGRQSKSTDDVYIRTWKWSFTTRRFVRVTPVVVPYDD